MIKAITKRSIPRWIHLIFAQSRSNGWWIISAKKQETRPKRLEKLIAASVQGQRLPEFAPGKQLIKCDAIELIFNNEQIRHA